MHWAILDTSVYIADWERGAYENPLSQVRRSFLIGHSVVVLSELRRGARTREAQILVEGLWKLASPPWVPTGEDWWAAGRIIQKIGDAHGWKTSKRRDFQNDTLIALTAKRHGATVVTADRLDFDLLSRELRIPVYTLRP